jgi:thioesterase domain-containing protein/acyl carrier protein
MNQQTLSEKRALLAKLLQRETYSYPLSHGQQALWVIHQSDPTNPAYNMALAINLQGDLKLARLRQASQALVERHSALRTTVDFVNGELAQIVQPNGTYSWNEHQVIDYPEDQLWSAMKRAHEPPFDLTKGPVLRLNLFQIQSQRYILLLTIHHICGDAGSLVILGNDLLTFYQAELTGQKAVLPPIPVGYADFVRSETALLNSAEGEKLSQYWKQQLAVTGEIPILHLPTDSPRPAVQSFKGATVPFCLSAKLAQQLKQLAQQKTVTLYTLFLTAFQILLHRYTGQPEIWIGTPASIARRDPQLANLVGYLANTVVLRATIDDPAQTSFNDLLSKNRETVRETIEYSAYPFILLVKMLQPKRDLGYSPLFQASLDLKQADFLPRTIGDLAASQLEFPQMEGQFDVILGIMEGEQLVCRIYYSTDLFRVDTIERMVGHVQALLTAIIDNLDGPIAQLPFLTDDELRQLQGWRDTATLKDTAIAGLFEPQTKTTPEQQVVVNSAHNTQLYILDVNHQLVPIGVPGQLCVGGIQGGRDSLNRPEFAAEKFVEVKLFGQTERVFQTGHLAKWLPDGSIEFLHQKTSAETATRPQKSSYEYPRDQTEFRLIKLWEELFDISPISVLDDFFEIGGDSLLGIRLIFGIQKTFGVSIQLHSLFQHKTPEQLACVIRENCAHAAWSPLVCLQSQGDKAPLFFVHAAGGSAFNFFEIATLLGTERPFYAIQPRGTEKGDTFHATVEEMAVDYVTAVRSVQQTGPYLLGGWSFGATVAFEMARILERAGETISLIIMVDTPSPFADVCKKDDFEFLMDRVPHYYGVNLDELDLQETREQQVSYLLKAIKLAGLFTPDIDQDYALRWFKMYKHHNLTVASYNPTAPINAKMVFFKPSEAIPFDLQMGNPSVAWQPFARGGYEVHNAPGNHFDMISPRNTPSLVAHMKACIQESVRN